MKVFIYATEGLYQGLHGIYSQDVVEVDDIEEAKQIAIEMSDSLISDFGLEEEYEDSNFDIEYNCLVYSIRYEYENAYTCAELSDIAYNEGYEYFIEKYCGEELL